MNRRDRAQLAVSEIEAVAERGEGVTREQVELAVLHHALDEAEAPAVEREVRRVLIQRGYDVKAPGPDRLAVYLAIGALLALFWIGVWQLAIRVI